MNNTDMHAMSFEKNLKAGQKYSFALIGSLISSDHTKDPYNETERMTIYAALERKSRLLDRHLKEWGKLWESADSGFEGTPVNALTGGFEHHITGDVAIAAWQYYLVTGNKSFLFEVEENHKYVSQRIYTEYKIKSCKRIIKRYNFTISEISYKVGFSDPNYFSRSFKMFFDETPSTFRDRKH